MRSHLSTLSCLALALLACTGCGPLPGKPTAADVPLKPRQVRDFAALYAENCAGCHGRDGKGNGALALANPVYLAIASDDMLRRATAQGVPGTLMPAFATSEGGMVTDEQIDIIVSGIRSHWAKPDALPGETPPPYTTSSAGNAQRGKEAFATFCASCHGADGQRTEKS